MKNLIIDYGKSGNNYYYEEGQLYTEIGELVPEGEALVLHFRETGRTPLATAFYTQLLSKDHFRRFDLFLDYLPQEEREDQIRKAIKSIQKHISFLSQTDLAGDERIGKEVAYEKQIRALEQRLQGNTGKSWDDLRQFLIGQHIDKVSPDDFNHVMNYHNLPSETKPITWLSDKVEGMRFAKMFGFKTKDFKKCFLHKSGIPFHDKFYEESHPVSAFEKTLKSYT